MLPTARSARFSSGLGVLDFMKRTSILKCGPEQLRALGPAAIALGEAEGLGAHVGELLPGELRAAAGSSCQADARIDVTRPASNNFWWSATRTGKGAVTLDGEAPDASSRSAIAEMAGSMFPGERVEDQMTVVSKRIESANTPSSRLADG